MLKEYYKGIKLKSYGDLTIYENLSLQFKAVSRTRRLTYHTLLCIKHDFNLQTLLAWIAGI